MTQGMEDFQGEGVQLASLQEALALYPAQWVERFARVRAELSFAAQLCKAHPEQATEWLPQVIAAGRTVTEGLRQPHVDAERLTADAEALLAPLHETAKSYTLLCVGHAHIDMNWQWSWPETVALTHDTFETMLVLMEEFPQFLFSQSQASVYALIEKYDPPLFARIRQRVQEGRWEVTASQWVEGDKNMASGESISRHLLYTRAYFAEKFGLSAEDVPIDFEPDTFGHAATLPTILARGGVRYYYHCRGSRGPHLYWWFGPDGSRLLAFNDAQWYMHFAPGRQIAVAANMVQPLTNYAQETGVRQMAVLYGVGDHGGGPTRRDLRRLIEMDTWPLYPNVTFSTLRHFFEVVEEQEPELPEISGERNFVFTGCYTSQARQKEANRHGENLLYTAEVAAALGAQVGDVPYPQENLQEAWQYLLFDQFHDILPGSGVRETRHYTLGQAQKTQAAAGMARTNALRALAERVNTAALREGFDLDSPLRAEKDAREAGLSLGAGVGNASGTGGESGFSVTRTSDRVYLVFNPLPFARTERVEVKLWDTQLRRDQLVVNGLAGEPLRVQVVGEGRYAGHNFLAVAFPVTLPPLGYRTVCVSDRAAEFGLPEPPADLWGRDPRVIPPEDVTLENEVLALRLDPASGSITSLVDKRSGRELVPQGERLGLLHYCIEANEGMSAWRIGQFRSCEALSSGELQRLSAGPHVQAFRWTQVLESATLGATRLELDVILTSGVPRVDFRLRVDWREVGDRARGIPHLRVHFPLQLEEFAARYEIPFGSIARDLCEGQEVPALRWVDLSEADGTGVTLVNRSKYGFNVDGQVLNMTLLRATTDPDPLPDLGEHVIEYALVPHGPDWSVGHSMRVGEAFNLLPSVTSCSFHEGELPPVASFVTVEPGNVRLTALKQSRDGDALILRLVEVEGRDTMAEIELSETAFPELKAEVVDILERSRGVAAVGGALQVSGRTLQVHMPAYSVRTVRVLRLPAE